LIFHSKMQVALVLRHCVMVVRQNISMPLDGTIV
jgi:hypothetical protein